MTRDEAITVFKAFMENPLFSDVHKQAFNIAIHDIKQRHEWDINKLMLVPKTEWEQEPTTKNDLGVDAISRADARSLICEIDIKHHTFGISRKAFKDLYNGIDKLPSVTPQEPRKGHWIKIGDRGFGWSDTVICKCSECEYQTEFVGKFDGHNLVIDAERADNYCSNCGADMKGEK